MLPDLVSVAGDAANRLPLYTINPSDFTGLDQLVKVMALEPADFR
jgi:hypothetical protein